MKLNSNPMDLFDKNNPYRIASDQRTQKLRERYRITSDRELHLVLRREADLAYERLFKRDQSVERPEDMDKIGDTAVTGKMLDLAKQELKSEITTVRLEVKQQGNNLTNNIDNLRIDVARDMDGLRTDLSSDMSKLRSDLTSDMNNLRVELSRAMNDLRLDLTNKFDLMMQKMDENQARWRVDLEEQRHFWGLAHDHYVRIWDEQLEHGKRLDDLELSR